MSRLMAPTRRAVGFDQNRRPMHLKVRPRGAVYRATRLLTALVVRLRPSCRIAYSLDTTDRRLIETVILPYIAGTEEYQRIVFVGVQLYTRHYESEYFSHKDFWTIDIDPRVARYGARQHVVDSIVSLGVHFRPSSVDAIVCNGIFSCGLEEDGVLERAAFQACRTCLRPDGLFILGWDDAPGHPFAAMDHPPLDGFNPYVLSSLSAWRVVIEPDEAYPLRHVFDFYRPVDPNPATSDASGIS